MSLTVHIERLVLDGLQLDARGRALFAASLEAELGRRLQETGLGPALNGGIAVPVVPGGTARLTAGAAPAALAVPVAAAVHGGLQR